MCKYCEQKYAPLNKGYGDDRYKNQIELVNGGWTSLYIGVNSNNKIVMRACGDDYTNDYYPKYCPECGRKLRDD